MHDDPTQNPKLKSLFLYVFECIDEVGPFDPATNEGIVDIRWFPSSQMPKLLTHRSLRLVLRSLMGCLHEEERKRSLLLG